MNNRSLNNIERTAGLHTSALTTLATNNQHFISRKADLAVKRLSSKALYRLIVTVRDLINILAVPLHCSAITQRFAFAIEHLLDLTQIANLYHLLLCLQAQLLRQLVFLCVELVRDHIAQCQKTCSHLRDNWFFEFPDVRRPLSTTWPWAIKPSLAVLWGVCWMFFASINWDTEDSLIDLGYVQVSRRGLEQLMSDPAYSSAQQDTQTRSINTTYNISQQMSSAGGVLYHQPGAYPQFSAPLGPAEPRLPRNGAHLPSGSAIMATQPQRARPRPAAGHTQPTSSSSSRVHNASGESRRASFCLLNREANSEAAGQHHQAAGSHLGLVQIGTNTAYSAAPPTAAHPDSVAEVSWLPEVANFQPVHHNAYFQGPGFGQWREQDDTSQRYPQPAHTRGSGNLAVQTHGLPPRPRSISQVTPTIRVTPEQPNTPDSQVQPQDSHHNSATSLHAPYSYGAATYIDTNSLYAGFDMADVQIPGPPPQVGQMGPNGGIASPISDNTALSRPISPSNAQMNDPNIRKRSFSEMTQPPPPPPMQMLPNDHQSPQPSPYNVNVNETSPGGMDPESGHKVQRMIKRGDPPQAHDGKYYCNFAPECADQYFDRKCEWR